MAANNPPFVALAFFCSYDLYEPAKFRRMGGQLARPGRQREERFTLDPETTCQVLLTLSKGSTKSLSVIKREADPEHIFDVLPNFLSLEKLRLTISSISSRQLISILQSLRQITTVVLHNFQDTPMGRLTTIQLNLRRLSTYTTRQSTLHDTVANIADHSPDLVSLTARGTPARKELTTKLGDGMKCLSLSMEGKLPPISCKGLKYLRLDVRGRRSEPFEPYSCDLSYLTLLELYSYSANLDLSLRKAYNIGENLEFLYLDVPPQSEVFLRTPKLKELGLADLSKSMPLHVCPELRTIQYGARAGYLATSERNERKRQLESQGYWLSQNRRFVRLCCLRRKSRLS